MERADLMGVQAPLVVLFECAAEEGMDFTGYWKHRIAKNGDKRDWQCIDYREGGRDKIIKTKILRYSMSILRIEQS